MPTTPIFALRYPAATDPADVPLDVQELALDAEAKLHGKITTVAALPGSPYDGQVVIYQNTAMAALGLAWTFRYRSAASGSYKWEFIGGSRWEEELTNAQGTAAITAYHDLSPAGPSITVPLAGDYEVQCGCRGQIPASAGGIMSYLVGATAPVDADGVYLGAAPASLDTMGIGKPGRKTLTAGVVLKCQYRGATAVSWAALQRWLTVCPIRVG